MTKFIHILFVSIALLVVLSSAGLAHHHHNGEVHFAVDQSQDNACCNTETESNASNSDCVFEKEYCNTAHKYVDLFKNFKELFTFPGYNCFQEDLLYRYESVIITSYWYYRAPHIPYFSISKQGLRAPPAI